MPAAPKSRRRLLIAALASIGAGTQVYGFSDQGVWKTYEAVEESWIRDRHALLLQQAPAACNAAAIDLEIRLTDLKKRAIEYHFLAKTDAAVQHVAVWQLGALQLPPARSAELYRTNTTYRKSVDQIRDLSAMLRRHPQAEILKRAQLRLWKTPEYREIHRRYMGRLQDLQLGEQDDEHIAFTAH